MVVCVCVCVQGETDVPFDLTQRNIFGFYPFIKQRFSGGRLCVFPSTV